MPSTSYTITAVRDLIFISLFLSSSITVSAAPTSPEPRNATEAVFFASGMVEAQMEGTTMDLERSTSTVPVYRLPFRLMASIAQQMAFAFAFDGYTLVYWYFTGRAAVFHQMADLAGEPNW